MWPNKYSCKANSNSSNNHRQVNTCNRKGVQNHSIFDIMYETSDNISVWRRGGEGAFMLLYGRGKHWKQYKLKSNVSDIELVCRSLNETFDSKGKRPINAPQIFINCSLEWIVFYISSAKTWNFLLKISSFWIRIDLQNIETMWTFRAITFWLST